jgi:hypothetical protein
MSTTPPIACTLTPDQLRARRDGLLPGLAERAQSIEQVDGRICMRFAPHPEIVTTIAKVVDAERQCCRFLAFTFSIPPDLGAITLEIAAPPEAHSLLAELVTLRQGL